MLKNVFISYFNFINYNKTKIGNKYIFLIKLRNNMYCKFIMIKDTTLNLCRIWPIVKYGQTTLGTQKRKSVT